MRLVMLSILTVCALVTGCTNTPPEGPDLSATVAASVQATVEAQEGFSASPTPMPPSSISAIATAAPATTAPEPPSAAPAPVATPTQQVYGLPTDAWKPQTPTSTPSKEDERREYYNVNYGQWRDSGKPHEEAVSLARSYTEARMRGDSHEAGHVYSVAIEYGLSELSARAAGDSFASELDRLLSDGASYEDARERAAEYASIYVIAEKAGYSGVLARSYVSAYFTLREAGVSGDEARYVAKAYAGAVRLAMDEGFSYEEAVELSQYVIEFAGLSLAPLNPIPLDAVPLADENQPNEPATDVSLRELVNDYLTNALRADVKYESPFVVSGRITEIRSTGVVLLGAGGFNHVEARVTDKMELLAFDTGNEIHLRCQNAEGSSDSLGAFIYLKGCSVTTEGGK